MSQIVNGGGGGSGTVTNTGGALTANAVVLGAGGSDTKVSTGITTDGSIELDVGLNGGSAGILGLNGSTSGKVTLTAPAVAGTTSSAVACSNIIQTVGGISMTTGPTPAGSTTGIFNAAAQNIILLSNGTTWLTGNQNQVTPNKLLVMSGGNRLFVTSNFTTAANTNLQTITGLQFTNNASNANNWNFHAVLVYSQATAAAAVAFGIQAATNAPTNIFATGTQQITAGPPATVVTGTLATLTTTTATAIVSGTPGAQGVNYTVYLDGTMELAASANTINFMVSTATSGDAVTVLRGSYVNIW